MYDTIYKISCDILSFNIVVMASENGTALTTVVSTTKVIVNIDLPSEHPV